MIACNTEDIDIDSEHDPRERDLLAVDIDIYQVLWCLEVNWLTMVVVQVVGVLPEIRQVERRRREAEVGCKQSLI
jgi:predicted metal-binding membrane protein